MDKRFYVTIPYLIPPKIGVGKNIGKTTPQVTLTSQEFDNYRKELKQRVQVVESGLGSISIRTALLNTQQLIELLYSVYNPEEAVKEKLIAADELTGDVVKSELFKPPEKKEENA